MLTNKLVIFLMVASTIFIEFYVINPKLALYTYKDRNDYFESQHPKYETMEVVALQEESDLFQFQEYEEEYYYDDDIKDIHADSADDFPYDLVFNPPSPPFNDSEVDEDLPILFEIEDRKVVIEQKPKLSPIQEAVSILPEWLQKYIKWHSEKRLHHMHNSTTKFLVVACLRKQKCGGTADRLKPLPYFLLMAHRTQRVLLIKWDKFQLEDFLIPPSGGIDWRYPTNMTLGKNHFFKTCGKMGKVQLWDCKEPSILNQRVLLVYSQSDPYLRFKKFFTTEDRPYGTTRQLMQVMFQPTLPLSEMINDTMSKLNLVPGQYLAAHLRMRYPNRATRPPTHPNLEDPNSQKHFRSWAINSINCVIQKANTTNLPVYFAADYEGIISYILHESPFSSNQTNIPPVKVVGIEVAREHMEFPTKFTQGNSGLDYQYHRNDISQFYSVFHDLWILGNSKCISYGLGGYGLWASRWAGEECVIQHRKAYHNMNQCHSLVHQEKNVIYRRKNRRGAKRSKRKAST